MVKTASSMLSSRNSHPAASRKRTQSSSTSSASSHDVPKTPIDAYNDIHPGKLGKDFSVLKMKRPRLLPRGDSDGYPKHVVCIYAPSSPRTSTSLPISTCRLRPGNRDIHFQIGLPTHSLAWNQVIPCGDCFFLLASLPTANPTLPWQRLLAFRMRENYLLFRPLTPTNMRLPIQLIARSKTFCRRSLMQSRYRQICGSGHQPAPCHFQHQAVSPQFRSQTLTAYFKVPWSRSR